MSTANISQYKPHRRGTWLGQCANVNGEAISRENTKRCLQRVQWMDLDDTNLTTASAVFPLAFGAAFVFVVAALVVVALARGFFTGGSGCTPSLPSIAGEITITHVQILGICSGEI